MRVVSAMARRCDGPGGGLSCGVLWEIGGARLEGPHAVLGNRGSSYLILFSLGVGERVTRWRGHRVEARENRVDLGCREGSYVSLLVLSRGRCVGLGSKGRLNWSFQLLSRRTFGQRPREVENRGTADSSGEQGSSRFFRS